MNNSSPHPKKSGSSGNSGSEDFKKSGSSSSLGASLSDQGQFERIKNALLASSRLDSDVELNLRTLDMLQERLWQNTNPGMLRIVSPAFQAIELHIGELNSKVVAFFGHIISERSLTLKQIIALTELKVKILYRPADIAIFLRDFKQTYIYEYSGDTKKLIDKIGSMEVVKPPEPETKPAPDMSLVSQPKGGLLTSFPVTQCYQLFLKTIDPITLKAKLAEYYVEINKLLEPYIVWFLEHNDLAFDQFVNGIIEAARRLKIETPKRHAYMSRNSSYNDFGNNGFSPSPQPKASNDPLVDFEILLGRLFYDAFVRKFDLLSEAPHCSDENLLSQLFELVPKTHPEYLRIRLQGFLFAYGRFKRMHDKSPLQCFVQALSLRSMDDYRFMVSALEAKPVVSCLLELAGVEVSAAGLSSANQHSLFYYVILLYFQKQYPGFFIRSDALPTSEQIASFLSDEGANQKSLAVITNLNEIINFDVNQFTDFSKEDFELLFCLFSLTDKQHQQFEAIRIAGFKLANEFGKRTNLVGAFINAFPLCLANEVDIINFTKPAERVFNRGLMETVGVDSQSAPNLPLSTVNIWYLLRYVLIVDLVSKSTILSNRYQGVFPFSSTKIVEYLQNQTDWVEGKIDLTWQDLNLSKGVKDLTTISNFVTLSNNQIIFLEAANHLTSQAEVERRLQNRRYYDDTFFGIERPIPRRATTSNLLSVASSAPNPRIQLPVSSSIAAISPTKTTLSVSPRIGSANKGRGFFLSAEDQQGLSAIAKQVIHYFHDSSTGQLLNEDAVIFPSGVTRSKPNDKITRNAVPNRLAVEILKNLKELKDDFSEMPKNLICKETTKPFEFPVVASDGNTYEEAWINSYLREHDNTLPDGITQQKAVLYKNSIVINVTTTLQEALDKKKPLKKEIDLH